MESKRELKKKVNRQSMIEAALLLFSKKSFDEVSVRDIAKHAQVSPALIYKYFDDQQHLFLVAMQQENEKLLIELTQYETIEEIAKNYVKYMFENNTLYKMMAFFMISSNKERMSNIFFNETNQLYIVFKKNIEKCRNIDDIQLETRLLFSTLNGLLITYQNLPNLSSAKQLEQALLLVNHYLKRFEQ